MYSTLFKCFMFMVIMGIFRVKRLKSVHCDSGSCIVRFVCSVVTCTKQGDLIN